MPTEVRATFAAAARTLPDLVDRIPSAAWDGPGLGEWSLRSLVGHTSRSLITVLTYLQQPAERVRVPSAAAYYDFVKGATGADPAGVTERGRQAGVDLGAQPSITIRALVDDALAALDAVTGDPVIETIAGGMHLDDYLPTRIFELAVHCLDIAAAIDATTDPAGRCARRCPAARGGDRHAARRRRATVAQPHRPHRAAHRLLGRLTIAVVICRPQRDNKNLGQCSLDRQTMSGRGGRSEVTR